MVNPGVELLNPVCTVESPRELGKLLMPGLIAQVILMCGEG